jgi:SAM-dependent methyltransferase
LAARYFGSPETWPACEHELLTRARGRILDIGAGAGRHSLELQARGLAVTGLDTSPGALEVCRRRGLKHVLPGAIDDIPVDAGRFDTFLMMGNNLGLLIGPAEAPRVLASLATVANRGALILGTMLDPYQTDAPEHLAYHEENRSHGRLAGSLRLRVRYRGLASEWFGYLFVSRTELRALIEPTSWRLVDLIGDGAQYGAVLELTEGGRNRSL